MMTNLGEMNMLSTIKTSILITGILLFFLNCTTSFSLKLVQPESESDKINKFYVDGKEIAVSVGKESLIGVYGYKEANQDLVLFVFCQNLSKERAINFIPESIKVIGYRTTGRKFTFKTYSAEEYLKKLRTKQTWALMALALSGAMQSYNAGKSTTYTSGTFSGTYGTGSFTAYSTTYDYNKQAEFNQKNNERLIQVSQQMELLNRATEKGLLKANTLFPGQYVAGNVMIKISSLYLNRILIEIPAGGDIHRFFYVPEKR
jgi:hypothetical protein